MKRKSEDTEGKEAPKLVKDKKRKKKHRHHPDNAQNDNRTPQLERKVCADLDNGASRKDVIKTRLDQLEQIARDIASDPESIRKHIESSGEVEIINATAELARAFAQSELSSKEYPDAKQQAVAPSLEPPPIKDKTLETAVFTHQGEIPAHAPPAIHHSYDRLEILGDAYLEVIATRLIWDRFQSLPPGRISQIRELLVKNETLAQFSERFKFDQLVRVSPEIRSQPKRWVKVKGDVFEAYAAAVILSDPINGFNLVEDWLVRLWGPILDRVQPEDQATHHKESLAKRVMGKGVKLRYIDESPPITRKGGMATFFIGVYLTGWGWESQHLGSGTGLNKVAAGNAAAKQALENHPLINQIHAVKKAFDQKVKAERESALGDSTCVPPSK
ncbi:predicted protein [Uncinocarpus reesii 1704]|uniref:RNase III domain-containing protein n=1 Tax=Uncinocarpus reesii (strain UAMH 1704) TaxID=336963 RepID=C4JMK2_UNCRE|nr:uncharacterized protein UREG_04060 [Uncinocarpus reesii 1704]EEP79214.1 predicted protein [Uncinocarpus reesii 1704]